MLRVEDIIEIREKDDDRGFEIVFDDGRIIWLTKRRTIISLLMLIKYGASSEADLARGSIRIQEVKSILANKCPEEWILDGYADANKPFSELWNEEGFSWIHPAEEKLKGNQQYVLKVDDHEKLFTAVKKAFRTAPKKQEKEEISKRQEGLCNFCGSRLLEKKSITISTFAKDRVRQVFDHRIPVEKGGDSNLDNYQALCFSCNKYKWQICNLCHLETCDPNCALVKPESHTVISPTNEDISDRLYRRR
ncbi:HNH endonuclease [Brevibacillus choshinensis]|uniref:HNH endonuclease n=1 Tax=Brevibacillus choshinensis TaxID=54911 RepID=A0ABX7FQX7_BRECH|nr:HNH endonuclease signature motif containing protein [Brevibacillus choshinensis]QRG67716.1 HNH endonuclease [Brevibacillus choshinensis]